MVQPAANERLQAVLQERAARVLGRRSLLGFTTYTFPDYVINWHHRLTAATLDRWAFGDIQNLVIIEPPRHGKTELVGRRLPAYILGRLPEAEIIGVSHTQDLANEVSNDLQSVMEDPRYRALFPGTTLPNQAPPEQRRRRDVQSARKFTVVGHRGSYRCAGIGGSITGKGMMFGIIDDPIKNRKEADSLLKRQEVWGWYQSTFYTRLERHARILINMTRWHEDDLVGRLLKEAAQAAREGEAAEHWHVLWLPATAEEQPPEELVNNPQVTLIRGDGRRPGEPLWPWKYPAERLARIRGALGGPSARNWLALYQGRPRQEDGEIFRASMIGTAVRDGLDFTLPDGKVVSADDCLRFQAVDLATSERDHADYTVVATFYGHPGTQALILADLTRERITGGIHELVIESQRVRHRARFTGIEAKFFGQELVQRMLRSRKPVRELKADTDKFTRAAGVLWFFEAGRFYLASDLPKAAEAREELLKFAPGCAHDDIVDAIVYGATIWTRGSYQAKAVTAAEAGATLPEPRDHLLRQIRPPRPRP